MTLDDRPTWHLTEADEALARLEVSEDGLDEEEVEARRRQVGPNTFGEHEGTSELEVLLHQLKDPLVYVLLGALGVTLAVRSWDNAIVIGAVLVVNTVIGFLQEYRAESAVQALMERVSPRARVLRDGEVREVDGAQLVPGDLVLLREGEMVPADLRLVEVRELRIDEAALTGESVPVPKRAEVREEDASDAPPAEQETMAFMGTAVTAGRGRGLVVRTGEDTEVGDIAARVRDTGEVQTPLVARMERLSTRITVGIGIVAVVAMGIGLAMGRDWQQMVLLAVSLAVAAIPAGLPIVMTVALAIGVRRMARRNALIRRLPAVETLGSCTAILSDKTGTLTCNDMEVEQVVPWDHDEQGVLLVGLLASDIDPDADPPSGDPMEVAFARRAADAGLDPEACQQRYPRIDEVPFRTERRFNATVHDVPDDEDGPLVLVKGAPEVVAAMCPDVDTDEVHERDAALAEEGLRVLAMASGRGEQAARTVCEDEPHGLSFVGLQGLLDPPRPSAADAIAACRRAGIRVLMVTGDHAATAAAIAREVGLDASDDDELPEARTGAALEDLDDEAIDEVLDRVSVFARVQPAHKHRLVERMKDKGEVVAVTGDGVNDAPALESAHLGVAMGSGTEVARSASDMVITDDDFASVQAAVQEGRTAFRNIRMAAFFLLSTGAADVVIILASLGLDWPLPLLPAQILWCNVVTNGIADVAMAFEPGDASLAERPPRDPDAGVLDRLLLERLVLVGLWLAAGVLLVFTWVHRTGGTSFAELAAFLSGTAGGPEEAHLTLARTAALTTLVLFQKVHVFNCRSEDRSVFTLSPLGNKVLLVGVLASLAVHVGALYVPVTQRLLSVEPLGWQAWVVMGVVALTAIAVNEAHKALRTRPARRSA